MAEKISLGMLIFYKGNQWVKNNLTETALKTIIF